MKNIFKKFLITALAALLSVIVIVGCDDDESTATFTKPSLAKVSPAEALRGSTITISGDKLQEVVKVKFGNLDATNFTVSANEITATVPQGLAEGVTKVTVFYAAKSENNLGASDDSEFTVLYAPMLSAADPSEAKPTYEVKLEGDFLKRATKVAFGNVEAAFVAEQKVITATVPADAVVGENLITVTTPGGVATIPFKVMERTPEIHSVSPEEGGKTGAAITVTGLFFNEVQSVKIGSYNVADYDVVSPTEIKFNIPNGAKSGVVTVTTAKGSVSTSTPMTVVEIPYIFYDEGLNAEVENWSWDGTDVFNSTDVAKVGTQAYKRTYTADWSGVQLHHGSLQLKHYKAVKFSVYGGPGTTGKTVNFTLNWGSTVTVTLKEGEWTDYTVQLTDVGNPAVLDNLIFQDNGNSNPKSPYVMYVDNIQFVE